jgi:cytochrome c556
MRWSVFLLIQCLITLLIIGGFYIHQEHVIVLKEPPDSIKQWYKPQNKRQVWLHTMFRLRREMLAIEIYAKTEDDNNLQKWVKKLNEDYREIAEMVPEWQKKLDLKALADVQKNIDEKRYNEVAHALVVLDESCQSCHRDFRVVTATRYRIADFSDIKVDGSASLISHMRTMSKQVNKIKIASIDDRSSAALSALIDLKKSMDSLGGICKNCHKISTPAYPDETMTRTMLDLEQSLKTGSLEEQSKVLGTLAVMVCAECHGTHRFAHDAKELLNEKKSWTELLKHSF